MFKSLVDGRRKTKDDDKDENAEGTAGTAFPVDSSHKDNKFVCRKAYEVLVQTNTWNRAKYVERENRQS